MENKEINEIEEFKSVLNFYKSKLENEYARANSSSKKVRIAEDLLLFSSMCYSQFDGIIDKFTWDYDQELFYIYKYNRTKFLLNMLQNKEFYNKISKSVIDSFVESKFPLYKDYYKIQYCNYPRITQKEANEIKKAFISDYDETWLNNILTQTNESLIYKGNLLDCGGCIYGIPVIEKSFIFNSDQYGDNILSACHEIHEYGHSYEFDLNYKSKMLNNMKTKEQTPFTELASSFFEYAFIMYLKENRIYEESIEILLKYYYLKLLKYNFDINVITNIEKITLNDDFILLEDDETKKYIENLKEKLNFYKLSSYKDEINFTDSFIYGIGTHLSVYLYENYKQDKNNFKKEFKNSLLNYPITKDLSAFNNLGITEDRLINSNTLTKVLKKHSN